VVKRIREPVKAAKALVRAAFRSEREYDRPNETDTSIEVITDTLDNVISREPKLTSSRRSRSTNPNDALARPYRSDCYLVKAQ
jgi:hypothetical protein